MQELRAGDIWGINTIRHVGSFTIVPLIGDGISDGTVVGSNTKVGRTISCKVLTISTATLVPLGLLVLAYSDREVCLHVVSKHTGVGSRKGSSRKVRAPGQGASSVVSTVLVVVPESNALVVSRLDGSCSSSADGNSLKRSALVRVKR